MLRINSTLLLVMDVGDLQQGVKVTGCVEH